MSLSKEILYMSMKNKIDVYELTISLYYIIHLKVQTGCQILGSKEHQFSHDNG